MNNRELKSHQRVQDLEQEQLVGYWIKRLGISKRDLDTHPQIDDVIFLIRVRDQLGKHFNNRESGMWGFCWSYCYHKKCNLKKKHWRKLETLVTGIHHRLEKQAQARQRIKAINGTLEKPIQS